MVDTKKQSIKKLRCYKCYKKLGLTGIECKCSHLFCEQHIYHLFHDCDYDFVNDAKIRLENNKTASATVDKIVGEKL